MRIGQLEKETSIPVETLRFWERQGLLTPSRQGSGRYRDYSEDDIKRIKFILNAKSVGFTLTEILKLIEMKAEDDERTRYEVLEFAKYKLKTIEDKLEELTVMRQKLSKIINDCNSNKAPADTLNVLKALDKDIE